MSEQGEMSEQSTKSRRGRAGKIRPAHGKALLERIARQEITRKQAAEELGVAPPTLLIFSKRHTGKTIRQLQDAALEGEVSL